MNLNNLDHMTLMIITDILVDMGGSERNIFQLAHGLREKGHRIIICSKKSGDVLEQLHRDGFDVIDLNITRIYGWHGLKTLLKLIKTVKSEDVSVLLSYHKTSDLMGALISKITGIPVISSRRDMGFLEDSKDLVVYRLINPHFSAITTVSKAVKDRITESQKVNPDKTFVIYNGIESMDPVYGSLNDSGTTIREDNDKGLKICCLGALKYIKGQKILIEAARIVLKEEPSVRFFLAGNPDDPSYYSELMTVIKSCGLESAVTYLGKIDPDKVQKLWSDMDIAVCPSLSEGMSNAILEAMAAGKPIIATAVGGNPEVVKNDINGYLVPPNNPDALAATLLRLIRNEEAMNIMGQESYKLASTEFSLHLMYNKYEDLMKLAIIKNSSRLNVALGKGLSRICRRLYNFYKASISFIAYYIGINRCFLLYKEAMSLGKPRIFCFHDVSKDGPIKDLVFMNTTPENFHEAIKCICRNYEVLDIEKVVEIMKQNVPLKRDVCALTFDDCYKGWYEYVLPICLKEKIPFTLFVTTGNLDTREMLVYDALVYLIENTWRKVADLRDHGIGTYLLTDIDQVLLFLQNTNQMMKKKTVDERKKIISELESYFGVSLKNDQFRSSILSWNELVEIDKMGGKIGSHTVNHPDMEMTTFKDCFLEASESKNVWK
jgi:glycosyltransferase involved in cell wall biosynthesis/peptidoglycan/xylan/chitin deacetylase (PgdA/CDA1 family)